ncbi:hypothetical protein ZHAS_00011857 [Anopheles sinensis]|uniref:Uncharacterized protein n=1 Tax=Anopheles sinensis TaxID=74873 RepID=A0A084W1D4_ANOSI|nr:hypothetical protein ZHAS_00011857 [Anopheles sinensis]
MKFADAYGRVHLALHAEQLYSPLFRPSGPMKAHPRLVESFSVALRCELQKVPS